MTPWPFNLIDDGPVIPDEGIIWRENSGGLGAGTV